MKKHKVEIPEGYEFVTNEVKADGDELRVSKVYRKKPIKKELPKTWEEFTRNSKNCYPRGVCNIRIPLDYRDAFDALGKLIELRDIYNDGIERTAPYSIYRLCDAIAGANHREQGPLVLNNTKLGIEFGTNFRDLIETAKFLL